jgi:hypothetical protein
MESATVDSCSVVIGVLYMVVPHGARWLPQESFIAEQQYVSCAGDPQRDMEFGKPAQ